MKKLEIAMVPSSYKKQAHIGINHHYVCWLSSEIHLSQHNMLLDDS